MEFSTSFKDMTDAQLLKAEKDLYAESWRAATRSTVTAATGTVSGIATAGVSTIIAGPVFAYRTKYSYNVSSQLIECSAIVRERGLRSLGTAYWRIICGGAITCTFGTLGLIMPGADAVVDTVLAPIAEQVFGATEQAIEAVAEAATESLVESQAGEAVVQVIDQAADAMIDWLQSSEVVEQFNEITRIDVVTPLTEQLEALQSFLHDSEQIQAKIEELLEKKLEKMMVAQFVVVIDYLARQDLATYIELLMENPEQTERMQFAADKLYALPPQQYVGFWGWFGWSTPVLPAGIMRDIATMTESELGLEMDNLITQSIEKLRTVYAKANSILGGCIKSDEQRLKQHLDIFVLSRSLVLLHYELEQCRSVGGRKLSVKVVRHSRCASVALIQAAAVICATQPTDPPLVKYFSPSETLRVKTARWRTKHLESQVQLIKRQVEAKRQPQTTTLAG